MPAEMALALGLWGLMMALSIAVSALPTLIDEIKRRGNPEE